MCFIRLVLASIFASIAVCFTLLVLLYYTPSWQTALVLEIAKEDPSRQYQVELVSLRLNSVEAKNVFVIQDKYGLQVESLNIEIPLWKLIASDVDLNGGIVDGVVLDVSSIRIGDTTASDWIEFLARIKEDESFWKYRVGQIIQTLSNYGYTVELSNLIIEGVVLLPNSESVPFSLFIRNASSDAIDDIEIKLKTGDPEELNETISI